MFATRAQFNAWRARFTPTVQPWANAYFTSRLRALVGHLEGGFAKAYPSFFHEGFHQFMHRYVPRAPIWLNEGLADYVAEQVLGERSTTGEQALAMAKYFVIKHKPIDKLFTFTESPPGEYYPIAHSVVIFLIRRDHDAFVRMINDIKKGSTLEQALAKHYKGMTLKSLELAWRGAVRETIRQELMSN